MELHYGNHPSQRHASYYGNPYGAPGGGGCGPPPPPGHPYWGGAGGLSVTGPGGGNPHQGRGYAPIPPHHHWDIHMELAWVV
eukprot:3968177-Ditylum_brightwellii.AAC.2